VGAKLHTTSIAPFSPIYLHAQSFIISYWDFKVSSRILRLGLSLLISQDIFDFLQKSRIGISDGHNAHMRGYGIPTVD
jgi:hypothetical protein